MLFPLILAVIAIYFRGDFQHYFLNFDPAYAYLFNGANLASFTTELGHTDHPGTPLQILIGIIVRIGYWMTGSGELSSDFISRPEYYLTLTSNVIIFLIIWAVYFTGKHLMLATNVWAGLFYQLTCLGSLAMMRKMPGVLTEPVLGLVSVCLLGILIIHVFKPYYFKSEKRFIFYLSLLIAIGSATKITFVIMAIIPFIYLSKSSQKIRYVINTIVLFVLCIIPLIPNFSNFYEWIIDLFTHTDRYGKGDEGFIKVESFVENIGRTFSEDNVLNAGYWPGLIVLIVGFLGVRKMNIKSNAFRLLLSIMVACTLMILLVAKHYSFHYLLPVQMCMVSVWMLVLILWINADETFFKKPLTVIGFLIIGLLLLYRTLYFYIYSPDRYAVAKSSLAEVGKFEEHVPKIIGAANFHNHCALPEMALRFGLVYSGEPGTIYSEILKNKYPNTYYFNPNKGTPDHWLSFIGLEDLWRNSNEYYFISWKDDPVPLNEIKLSLSELTGELYNYNIEQIFENQWTKEVFYRITHTIPSDSIPTYQNLFVCDFETNDGNRFNCSNNYQLQSGHLRSQEFAKNGNSSVKLESKNNYALETKFQVKKGELYKFQIWVHGDEKVSIIATNKDPQKFYKGGASITNSDEDGWKQITLVTKIPPKMHDDSLKLYCYKPGKGVVHLDDFRVSIIPTVAN